MKVVDNISVLSIILVSFPEAVAISTLSVLSIGKFSFFKDKKNLLRILLYAVITAIASYFIRRNVNNETESLLVHVILLSLLLIFILRLKFYESILATVFGMAILVITEAISLLLVQWFAGIDITQIKEDEILRILLTLPVRFLQVVLIFISLKYKIRIIDFESATVKKREYFIHLVAYAVSISTLIFLAAIMCKILLLDHNNFNNPTNTVLLRINIYLSLFVTVILTLAIRNTHDYYKSRNSLNKSEYVQNLEYIANLLEVTNYLEAKKAINSLKDHISKQ